MILNPAPDDPGNLYKRLVSEDGKIEMGIYPVMFGFRVRAGKVGDMYYPLDWCGGDDLNQIQLLYTICKNILGKRETTDPFRGLPSSSRVKPFYKDSEFTKIIIEAAGAIESTCSITREEINNFKWDSVNIAMGYSEPKKEEPKEETDEELNWR